MAASGGSMNIDSTVTQVKRLINAHLKAVCKHAGLPVSGAKAALQSRIIDHLRSLVNRGDHTAMLSLKSLIHQPPSPYESRLSASSTNYAYPTDHMGSHSPFQSTSDPPQHRNGLVASNTSNGIGTRGPQFKESPFFNILEPLTPVIECQARESNRDTVHTSINLQSKTADSLNGDKALRALIYCTTDTAASPFSRVDISFPHQVEIKVNQDEVKGNLRGLKNKPGTTRPADITDLLRKRNGYSNDIAITYALTKNRYYLVVNLARQITVESLVEKLRSGKIITRDRVINEMISKAEDTDVVATSTILSLKCPLSTLRIQVPCRSTLCNHNQCFDAASFLQLQEQAPTWTCPICNKIVNFSNLHVDAYVDDILKSTPKTTEQVTIEPTGEWSMKSGSRTARTSRTGHASEDDDDDDEDDVLEIEASESQAAPIKAEYTNERSLLNTPSVKSRPISTPLLSRQNGANKRPAPPVVDLTLSSDEDEQPVRPKKRQNLNGFAAGAGSTGPSDNLPLRPSGATNFSDHIAASAGYQTSSYHELSRSDR